MLATPKGRRWNSSEMQTAWHSFPASSLPFIMAQSLCPGQEGPSVPTRPLHVALERRGPLDKTHPPRAHANLTDGPCDQGPAGGPASRRCAQREDAGEEFRPRDPVSALIEPLPGPRPGSSQGGSLSLGCGAPAGSQTQAGLGFHGLCPCPRAPTRESRRCPHGRRCVTPQPLSRQGY